MSRLTKIILVVPLEADLEIMVLGDHTEELVEKMGRLVLSQAVDVLDVVADSEDGLPACNWVGADDWVLGREFIADVKWGATRFSVELELLVLGSLSEERLGIGGSKSIKELLVGRRESVVDLITWWNDIAADREGGNSSFGVQRTRCPESVTSKSGDVGELQDSIVRWSRLKGDIRVPALLERLLLLVLLGLTVTEDLGSQIIADDRDLIILVALE
jgi:hypothetical protein